ncbi:orotidine-5'-phosphate decarboxylase [Halochromatium glycolicum]|uniref:Orotidine 5'-phosphate decarboxylase n=1 Tax=Halochromatium glycolicum TaxID=85075 RepID=A0AAJ0XA58_9GAMM|nr:orotidine-5'-phosphate decarboxylase [Halochromatium glycolicum]MBK1704452.1 orotidine-5'-phosphate decarboxylase [Halochromatium glycolicum]
MPPSPQTRIIVALDVASAEAALALADRLDPAQCRVKVGKELFTRAGPVVVEQLVSRGLDVFLDLKYHDIPNTVAGACAAAADLGVWMLNVHAAGGLAMMQAARERLAQTAAPPLLIAVTVLTSLDTDDLAAIGCAGNPRDRVQTLAELALQAGLDGLVCSPQEVAVLRERFGPQPLLVTPGVRPADTASGDQKRTMTPAEAIAAGADHLVIGRPITAAPDPMAAVEAIRAELSALPAGSA